MSTYCNDHGQLDTYWRPLPETDDPVDCLAYLLDWWRSKRQCEQEVYGPCKGGDHDRLTAEAMLTVEEEAIEHLLDTLAGTTPLIHMWELRRVATNYPKEAV